MRIDNSATTFSKLAWQCSKAGLRVGLVLEQPDAPLSTQPRYRQPRLQDRRVPPQ